MVHARPRVARGGTLAGAAHARPGQRGARRLSCLELSAGGSRSTGSFPSGPQGSRSHRSSEENADPQQQRPRTVDGRIVGGVEIKGPQSFTYLFLRISGYWHVDSESRSLAGPYEAPSRVPSAPRAGTGGWGRRQPEVAWQGGLQPPPPGCESAKSLRRGWPGRQGLQPTPRPPRRASHWPPDEGPTGSFRVG